MKAFCLLLRIILALLLILCVALVPMRLYERLNADMFTEELYHRRESRYYGTVTVWQIDSFEGGTGSRTLWLQSICNGFEMKNNGVYVKIESVNAALAKKLIKEKKRTPDIISFGAGCGFTDDDFISLADVNATRIEGSQLNNALVWCMGAYFIIGTSEMQAIGNDGKTVTQKRAVKDVYSIGIAEREGFNAREALSSFLSIDYAKPLSSKYGTAQDIFEEYNYSRSVNNMLGTQRDLYRLQNAQSKNKGRESRVTLVDTYNDLYQHIGILKNDNEKKTVIMKEFLEYLVSDSVQGKLGSIGMFPVNKAATPQYANGYITVAWEQIKQNNLFT